MVCVANIILHPYTVVIKTCDAVATIATVLRPQSAAKLACQTDWARILAGKDLIKLMLKEWREPSRIAKVEAGEEENIDGTEHGEDESERGVEVKKMSHLEEEEADVEDCHDNVEEKEVFPAAHLLLFMLFVFKDLDNFRVILVLCLLDWRFSCRVPSIWIATFLHKKPNAVWLAHQSSPMKWRHSVVIDGMNISTLCQ